MTEACECTELKSILPAR